MANVLNPLGQPVGFALPGWTPPPPPRAAMEGRYCRLEPLDPATVMTTPMVLEIIAERA